MTGEASAEVVAVIERGWALYGSERAVAAMAGVPRSTALKYKPESSTPRRCATPKGYATWSPQTQKRWDALWASGDIDLERLRDLLGVPVYSKRSVAKGASE